MTDMQQAHANVEAARALVAVLASCGRHVVVSPGARNAPLILAVDEHPEMIVHVVLDERAAAFVALGLAKATGRAAVLICTSGSAGGHYLPAVMEACHARVPLVVVTADRPDELQHVGAAQATDQTALFARHVRAFRHLPTPRGQAAFAEEIAAAWRLQAGLLLAVAEGTSPGPVHLNAPFAEPLLPPPAASRASPPQPAPTRPSLAPSEPTEAGYQTLVEFVRAHGPGVIVCGPLPSDPQASARAAAVMRLAAALGWPILADPLSGLRFRAPEDAEPPILCHYDVALQKVAAAPQPACVLSIGGQPTSKRLQQWLQLYAHVAVVLTAPGEPTPMQLHAAGHLQADVLPTCEGWAQRLRAASVPPCSPDHAAAYRAWDETAAGASAAAPSQPDLADALTPRILWPKLIGALPAGAGLHVGSSMPVRDFDRFGGMGPLSLRVSASRGLNGIDGFIATVTGLALGDNRRWTGVLGDLTFLHDVGALQAARQLQVTATLVVVNNSGGEIFTKLPIAQHEALFERYFRTPQEADIGALCRACACSHEVVYTGAALGDAVAWASTRPADGRLHVIEAHMAKTPPAP